MIKKTVVAAIVLAGAAFGAASQASAMPLAPAAAGSQIEHVRFGCGPGWHPNPWGRCVPNRPVVRRMIRREHREMRREWRRDRF